MTLWEKQHRPAADQHNYFRIGALAADLPNAGLRKCLDFCDYFGQKSMNTRS